MSWGRNCQPMSSFLAERFAYRRNRYHTDPSGTFVRYDAKAIGSGSEAAQSELQDKWHKVTLSFYNPNEI
jgi:hypothetical protein